MSGARGSPSILIVEDDPSAAACIEAALSERFDRIRRAGSGTEALLAFESVRPDLALIDLGLPDIDGLELLTMIRQRWPDVPAICVTATEEVATIVEAVRRGAINYLVKPVGPGAILAASERALATARSGKPLPDPAVPEIVGLSPAIVRVRHHVALAARCDVNVLLSGATGTGKELAARAIHRLSCPPGSPFVPHNCATTPAELFDSEFFGHRRGAFTGADRDQPGLLASAHGGILFLDELETLGPAQQAKLLRVLDDGEVRPLGSTEIRSLSLRFLAATNRDPRELLATGVLREDLYYRLRGLEIELPPLSERTIDIMPLAAAFIGEDARRLSDRALDALARYPWPGNVRQLRSVLRSAVALAPTGSLGPEHLLLERPDRAPSRRPDVPPPPTAEAPSPASLRDLERHAILRTLGECGGNKSRAARTLGIDRSTLRRKVGDLPDPG